MLPGLAGQFFQGFNFDERRGAVPVEDVATVYSTRPYSTLPNDDWSASYAGFVRVFDSGHYRMRCRVTSTNDLCNVYFNRSTVSDVTNLTLTGGVSTRIKIEYQHKNGANHGMYLEWSGPHTTEALAYVNTTFVPVPSANLHHEVVCLAGCNSRGVCIADDTCLCETGYSGPRCGLKLDSCGTEAVSGSLLSGGLRQRVYDNSDDLDAVVWGALALETVDSRMSHIWGYRSPLSALGDDDWTVVWQGLIKIPTTGWYNFGVLSDNSNVRLVVGGVVVMDWVEDFSQRTFLLGDSLYNIRFDLRHFTSYAVRFPTRSS
jgi:hypothetical protein